MVRITSKLTCLAGNTVASTVDATTLTCAVLKATAAFSTLKVTNLNCDLLDGKDWAAPDPIGNVTPSTVKSTTLESTGLATLASAKVSNLTASSYVRSVTTNLPRRLEQMQVII